MITTRCPLWRKSPMYLHTSATSQSWIPTTDTGQSSLIRNPAYSQPPIAPSEDTTSCVFPLALSQDIFQKKMDQILEECQGYIGIADDITIHSHTEEEHNAHIRNFMHVTCKYGLVFNPQKTHVKAQLSISLAVLMMLMVSTQTQIRSMLYMPYQCQQMSPNSRSFRHGNIPKFLHPWPVHLGHPTV